MSNADKDGGPKRLLQSLINRMAMYAGKEAPWWYLSFADASLPKGTQFLGAAVVRGFDIGSAAMEARFRNCNPGGEVLGAQAPEGFSPPERFVNRLLSREDIRAMDAELGSVTICLTCGRELEGLRVQHNEDGTTEPLEYCDEHVPEKT